MFFLLTAKWKRVNFGCWSLESELRESSVNLWMFCWQIWDRNWRGIWENTNPPLIIIRGHETWDMRGNLKMAIGSVIWGIFDSVTDPMNTNNTWSIHSAFYSTSNHVLTYQFYTRMFSRESPVTIWWFDEFSDRQCLTTIPCPLHGLPDEGRDWVWGENLGLWARGAGNRYRGAETALSFSHSSDDTQRHCPLFNHG